MHLKMLLLSGLTVCTSLSLSELAIAQTSNYYAGQAVNGQSINVDLASIARASSRSADFIYYLGNETIHAQANCQEGYWTTFPEREVHRPQSQATQNMLNKVCSYVSATSDPSSATLATVIDPPSNVRVSPNGDILCSIRQRASIHIYGSTGDWYYTDACGSMGVIHSSQLQF